MPTQTTKLAELLKAGRFALVGVAATLIHLGVAQAALATGGLSVFWANALGFVVAFVAGFLGHQYFTFNRTAPFWQAFRRYGVIALGGFIVNNVVLFGLVQAQILSEAVASPAFHHRFQHGSARLLSDRSVRPDLPTNCAPLQSGSRRSCRLRQR